MRFYDGAGFFGDIGNISYDLTKYGDLSYNKEIRLFSKALEGKLSNTPPFNNFKVWKNSALFD